MTATVEVLTSNFIHQKEMLMERSGVRMQLNRERMSLTLAPHMEKVAAIVAEWDIDPGVLIEAAFAWARKNRHPDGPLPNMLTSVKYLTNALCWHLELPREAIIEKRCNSTILTKLNESFDMTRASLAGSPAGSLPFLSSYPVEHRFMLALLLLDRDAMKQLAPQVLEQMAKDKLAAMWLVSRGVKYEGVAAIFNRKETTV